MNILEQTISDDELLVKSASLRDKIYQASSDYFFNDGVIAMLYSDKTEEQEPTSFSPNDADVVKNCLAYITAHKNPEDIFAVKDYNNLEVKQDTTIKEIISETKKVLEEYNYFMKAQQPGFDDGIDPISNKRTHFTMPVNPGFDGVSAFYLNMATIITNQGLKEKLEQNYKD